jgi:transcriptional regulator with XRE-family HTH domain
MTQDQLAEATGIERSKIAKIETGERKVNSTELLLIATAFQVPMESLLRVTAPVIMHRKGPDSDPVATQAVVDRFLGYVEKSLQTRELMAAIMHEA